jgi:hypothetical protein
MRLRPGSRVVTSWTADAVASNARLVPYVKASLAVSTGLVPAAVVTVTSTVPVPAEGATGGEHQRRPALNGDAATAHT